MIDKKEPLFITMMEYHSSKRSICNKTGPIVSLNDLPSLARNNTVFSSQGQFLFHPPEMWQEQKNLSPLCLPPLNFPSSSSECCFFFFFFYLLLLWMFLRHLTDRRLPGFLPTFFPFAKRHESAVGLPFHQLSKTRCLRQSETDRQGRWQRETMIIMMCVAVWGGWHLWQHVSSADPHAIR